MKIEKNLYHNTEKYMIRVPMFSVDKYFMFLSNYSDKEGIDNLIIALCNNTVFREAILAASENLYSKIDEYILNSRLKIIHCSQSFDFSNFLQNSV